jgi:hypothetical protein
MASESAGLRIDWSRRLAERQRLQIAEEAATQHSRDTTCLGKETQKSASISSAVLRIANLDEEPLRLGHSRSRNTSSCVSEFMEDASCLDPAPYSDKSERRCGAGFRTISLKSTSALLCADIRHPFYLRKWCSETVRIKDQILSIDAYRGR